MCHNLRPFQRKSKPSAHICVAILVLSWLYCQGSMVFGQNSAASQLASTDNGIPSSHLFSIDRSRSRVGALMSEILLKKFAACDIVIINDEFYSQRSIRWMRELEKPIISLNLDNPLAQGVFENGVGKIDAAKAGGSSSTCTSIMFCCFSLQSCQTSNAEQLFAMLRKYGILKAQRRTFLFIRNESVRKDELVDNATKLKSIKDTNDLRRVVEGFLSQLRSHITLIREFILPPGLDKLSEFVTFQLLTWTPNWIPGGSPIVYDSWSIDKGFRKNFGDVELTRKDIRNGGVARFCTSSKNLLPMIHVDEKGEFEGLDAELIRMFADRFQVKIEFFEPSDNEFGDLLQDGNWTGVIGFVVGKQADFGIGHIMFDSQRNQADLKFSPPISIFVGTVVCLMPGYLPKALIIIHPFDTPTWILLFIVLFLILGFFELVQSLIRTVMSTDTVWSWGKGLYIRNQRKSRLKRRKMIWLMVLAPLFQRSIPQHLIHRKYSFLCIFAFWLLYTFLVSVCYSTVLIGSLTFPPKEAPINSISQLIVRKGTGQWAISTLIEQNFQFSVVPHEIKLLQYAAHLGASNLQSAVDLSVYAYANSTGNCLVTEKRRAQYVIAKNYSVRIRNHLQPTLRVSRDSIFLGPTGWVIRGDIDFLMQSYFDDLFLGYSAHGLSEKTAQDFSPPPYHGLEKENNKSLGMDMILVVFYFLLVGWTISFTVFLVEIIIHTFTRKVSGFRQIRKSQQ